MSLVVAERGCITRSRFAGRHQQGARSARFLRAPVHWVSHTGYARAHDQPTETLHAPSTRGMTQLDRRLSRLMLRHGISERVLLLYDEMRPNAA
jgi:hypothetical protein